MKNLMKISNAAFETSRKKAEVMKLLKLKLK